MRKNFGSKPWLYPQLVLIIGTYDENGNPNAMNAAWGGMADYNKVMVCMSSHKTTENIDKTKEFTISFGDASHVVECDYVGIVSANKDKEKMKKSKFTTSKAEHVNAPIINELPLCLECRLIKIVEEDLKIRAMVEDMLEKEFSSEIKKSKQYDFLVDSVVNKLKQRLGNINRNS